MHHYTENQASSVQAFGLHPPNPPRPEQAPLTQAGIRTHDWEAAGTRMQYLWRPQVTHRGPAQILGAIASVS